MYKGFLKNTKQLSTLINFFLNQHIRMISKGSCDIEDWSDDCWKFSLSITGINYILKYIEIQNSSFKL